MKIAGIRATRRTGRDAGPALQGRPAHGMAELAARPSTNTA